MIEVTENLRHLKDLVRAKALAAGRDPGEIRIIAVSKYQPVASVRQAIDAGHSDFGENHLQEALGKIVTLADLSSRWHFIGHVQSNKTRPIAENFDWVHTVDRLKIATRLSEARSTHKPPLNVCLQVNVDAETSKSGVACEDVIALADAVAPLANIRLRGLMCIPRPSDSLAGQRRPFALMKNLFDEMNRRGYQFDTLSMGMSRDWQSAIAEGATMLRIGTAIFGERHG